MGGRQRSALARGASVTFHDYFRGSDDTAVIEMMGRLGEDSPLIGRTPAADGVQTTWIDPEMSLGVLVAAALGVEHRSDLVGNAPVIWPGEDDMEPPEIRGNPDGSVDVLDWGYDGPTVSALPDLLRDTLAGITDEQIPGLAAQWARETGAGRSFDVDLAEKLPLLAEFVGLGRRARDAGDKLYLWMTIE